MKKVANSRLKDRLDKLSPSPTIEEWHKMIKKRKPVSQLIQEILPDQPGEYGITAGRTGIGKTNLSLYLAFCLATGSPFFGLKCEKVIVNFMAFEGDPSNMAQRYLKLRGNFPDTEGRLRFEMLPIENPLRLLEVVFGKLKKTTGCKVVILDPVRYIVPGDYLKPKDVAAFVGEFKELLTAYGVSAIITLPIRKPGPVQGLIRPSDVYSIKGATEYVDGATSALLIEKQAYTRSKDRVTLHYPKHRIATKELKPINLRLNRNKCMFEEEEGSDIHETDEETQIVLRIHKQ
jgi:hypothetical protein